MSYIGVAPTAGQYRNLDDISGSFNGSTTTFTTAVSGQNVTAGVAQQLLVSLGGVVQKPGTDYTVGTNSITFTTAPSSGLSFFGILMGEAVNVGTPSDGTVTSAKLASDLTVDLASGTVSAPSLSFDSNTGLYSTADNEVAITTDGTYRAKVDGSGRLLVGTSSAPTGTNSQYSKLVTQGNTFDGNGSARMAMRVGVAASSLSAGSAIGDIYFVDNGAGEYARIACEADAQAGSGDYPGRLVFSTTADGASSPTERMRLDSSGNLKFNSGYGSVATAYGVRAWVNFNGQGPGSIRGNGNVSSFTKNANGDFTVNFTTAMPDGNYCALVSGNQDTTTSDKPLNVPYDTAPSTSAVRIINSGGVDYQYYMVAIIR